MGETSVSFSLASRQKGWKDNCFSKHPTEVIPDGLHGVATGPANLRAGKASAVNYTCNAAATN